MPPSPNLLAGSCPPYVSAVSSITGGGQMKNNNLKTHETNSYRLRTTFPGRRLLSRTGRRRGPEVYVLRVKGRGGGRGVIKPFLKTHRACSSSSRGEEGEKSTRTLSRTRCRLHSLRKESIDGNLFFFRHRLEHVV